MTSSNGQPLPSRRGHLVNVIFWQCAGYLIGASLPGAVLALIYPHVLPADPSERDVMRPLWVAGLISPATALVGGIIGSIVGFRDRTLPWRGKRSART
jgi:hypothetical protein